MKIRDDEVVPFYICRVRDIRSARTMWSSSNIEANNEKGLRPASNETHSLVEFSIIKN